MTKIVEQLAPQILELINKSQNILLHLHPNPDPDSVGSALAMMHILEDMRKRATVISGDSPKPTTLSFFPGFEKIIEKTYQKINVDDYDLFLVLDSASKDMISKLDEVNFSKGMTVVVIDHHKTNTNFGKLNLVDPTYPAAGELLFDIFKIWRVKMDKDVAACLFVAIYGDTGGFRYEGVTENTFLCASELARINPHFWKYVFLMLNSNEPSLIKAKGLAFSNIRSFFKGQVVISVISYEMIQEAKIVPQHLRGGDISSDLISVVDWDIGISLMEKEKGASSLSIRTRDSKKFDVSKLASALGGGGHKAAAGARIVKPLEDAISHLTDIITKVYPQLET